MDTSTELLCMLARMLGYSSPLSRCPGSSATVHDPVNGDKLDSKNNTSNQSHGPLVFQRDRHRAKRRRQVDTRKEFSFIPITNTDTPAETTITAAASNPVTAASDRASSPGSATAPSSVVPFTLPTRAQLTITNTNLTSASLSTTIRQSLVTPSAVAVPSSPNASPKTGSSATSSTIVSTSTASTAAITSGPANTDQISSTPGLASSKSTLSTSTPPKTLTLSSNTSAAVALNTPSPTAAKVIYVCAAYATTTTGSQAETGLSRRAPGNSSVSLTASQIVWTALQPGTGSTQSPTSNVVVNQRMTTVFDSNCISFTASPPSSSIVHTASVDNISVDAVPLTSSAATSSSLAIPSPIGAADQAGQQAATFFATSTGKGAIAGISIGGVAIVAGLTLFLLLWRRRVSASSGDAQLGLPDSHDEKRGFGAGAIAAAKGIFTRSLSRQQYRASAASSVSSFGDSTTSLGVIVHQPEHRQERYRAGLAEDTYRAQYLPSGDGDYGREMNDPFGDVYQPNNNLVDVQYPYASSPWSTAVIADDATALYDYGGNQPYGDMAGQAYVTSQDRRRTIPAGAFAAGNSRNMNDFSEMSYAQAPRQLTPQASASHEAHRDPFADTPGELYSHDHSTHLGFNDHQSVGEDRGSATEVLTYVGSDEDHAQYAHGQKQARRPSAYVSDTYRRRRSGPLSVANPDARSLGTSSPEDDPDGGHKFPLTKEVSSSATNSNDDGHEELHHRAEVASEVPMQLTKSTTRSSSGHTGWRPWRGIFGNGSDSTGHTPPDGNAEDVPSRQNATQLQQSVLPPVSNLAFHSVGDLYSHGERRDMTHPYPTMPLHSSQAITARSAYSPSQQQTAETPDSGRSSILWSNDAPGATSHQDRLWQNVGMYTPQEVQDVQLGMRGRPSNASFTRNDGYFMQ